MAAVEVYVSTDVEADGPIPGVNSMLSLASAAFLADRTLVGTYSVNLQQLPGADPDPATMAWWQRNQQAWQACRTDPQDPATAMVEYVSWLDQLPGRPVFVGYPAVYDFIGYLPWKPPALAVGRKRNPCGAGQG